MTNFTAILIIVGVATLITLAVHGLFSLIRGRGR